MPTEATPLLLPNTTGSEKKLGHWREDVYAFLEAKTSAGSVYERFTIVLILLNVVSFIFGSLFVEEYNKSSTDDGSVDTSWTSREHGLCGRVCDGLFFGNYEDNMLQGLNIGATSVLEIFTVAVFTLDYLWRIYLADLENPNRYSGFMGRIRYLPTFFSLVDLVSTVPFYVDSFFLRDSNLAASQVNFNKSKDWACIDNFGFNSMDTFLFFIPPFSFISLLLSLPTVSSNVSIVPHDAS
jgi:Ion transport protein